MNEFRLKHRIIMRLNSLFYNAGYLIVFSQTHFALSARRNPEYIDKTNQAFGIFILCNLNASNGKQINGHVTPIKTIRFICFITQRRVFLFSSPHEITLIVIFFFFFSRRPPKKKWGHHSPHSSNTVTTETGCRMYFSCVVRCRLEYRRGIP